MPFSFPLTSLLVTYQQWGCVVPQHPASTENEFPNSKRPDSRLSESLKLSKERNKKVCIYTWKFITIMLHFLWEKCIVSWVNIQSLYHKLLAELIIMYPFSHKNNYKGLTYTLGSTYMCVYTLSNSSLLVAVTPSRQYNWAKGTKDRMSRERKTIDRRLISSVLPKSTKCTFTYIL